MTSAIEGRAVNRRAVRAAAFVSRAARGSRHARAFEAYADELRKVAERPSVIEKTRQLPVGYTFRRPNN